MKNIVLASLLGTIGGVFVAPHVGGPVHYQVTRAHSLYGELPASASTGAVTVSLGTLPLDFVLQDFAIANDHSFALYNLENAFVKVNGSRVLASSRFPAGNGALMATSTHLNGGVFIPAGSTIEVEGIALAGTGSIPVTLSGYVQ